MKLLPWLAGILGSYVGWYIGALANTAMALVLSLVGAVAAGYYARKWVKENLA